MRCINEINEWIHGFVGSCDHGFIALWKFTGVHGGTVSQVHGFIVHGLMGAWVHGFGVWIHGFMVLAF